MAKTNRLNSEWRDQERWVEGHTTKKGKEKQGQGRSYYEKRATVKQKENREEKAFTKTHCECF